MEHSVVQADAVSPRKGNVRGGILSAGVLAAQQHTEKPVEAPEEGSVYYRSHEEGINRGIAGVTVVAGAAGIEGVMVIGAVGSEAEESAPIAGHRDVYALQPVTRLVDLVKAGVAVADKDLILVGGFGLLGGSLPVAGVDDLAGGRQGHERGRNNGQYRKQQLTLQFGTLLSTFLCLVWAPGALAL